MLGFNCHRYESDKRELTDRNAVRRSAVVRPLMRSDYERGQEMNTWGFWVLIFPFIVAIIYSIIEEKREGKR